MVNELGVYGLKAYNDSQLVVGHIRADNEARGEKIVKYLQKVKDLVSTFHSFEIQQLPREENSQANLLSKLVTSIPIDLLKRANFEGVKKQIIEESIEVMQLDDKPS